MADEEDYEDMRLNEVWRACRKVQTAIFRFGFNICAEFCVHDPHNTGLVSESIFIGILGKYKNLIAISDIELREITDYFRLRDGRVAYQQFCKVVCSESHDKGAKKDLVTGLEWNDPMHVNPIPRIEDRRNLCLTLIKISQISHLPLKPYFQDYELVSGNAGLVTVPHFSRVLHFMKIPLSDDDFLLLLKRYMKDSYLVNYAAFIKHVTRITKYLKDRHLLDNAMKILKDFPGKLVDLDLPELPVVDGPILADKIFKNTCNTFREKQNSCEVMICIQKHIHKNRIRVREFLEGFDLLRTGSITKNQFERGLSNMGVGSLITSQNFQMLCERYLDPIDSNRVSWRAFEDEVDNVFTVKRLEKTPQLEVESPPGYIVDMPRQGEVSWSEVNPGIRNICEEALAKIQTRIRARRLHLHPFFRNYDRLNSGHVRCNQVNQVLIVNGILLTEDELYSLHKRYGNEIGFNYGRFLEDADPAEYALPKLQEPQPIKPADCKPIEKERENERDTEEYVIKLLSSIKRQVVTRALPIIEFLQDYDRHREGEILETDFRRGLDNANVKVSPEDMDLLCKLFSSPKRACCVLYREFAKALDEIFVQIETMTGDNEVTAVPLIHLANLDCLECFLNFDERTICSQGLMKLARKPDEISNLKAVFKDFDRENCGSITQNQFVRALTVRDMHFIISRRELDCICKCFGIQRGLRLEFNYREFLRILDILFQTGQVKRNY